MVKNQIALERATHKVHPRNVWTQLRILLVEVLMIVVVLRGNLHEVAACARVQEVVRCSGRSGKTVKAQKYNGLRPYHYSITNSFRKVKVRLQRTSIYGGYSVYQSRDEIQDFTLTNVS